MKMSLPFNRKRRRTEKGEHIRRIKQKLTGVEGCGKGEWKGIIYIRILKRNCLPLKYKYTNYFKVD